MKKKQTKFLYAVKSKNSTDKNSQISIGPISSNFILALAKDQISSEIKVIDGIKIEQQKNKLGIYQFSFDPKGPVKINQENSLLYFPMNCTEVNGKYTIAQQDFRKFMAQFKILFKNDDSDEQSFSESQSNLISSQLSISQKGRGRPKGSKTKKKQDLQNSSDDEYLQTSNKISQQKRGRGRPKGAKNKKKFFGDDISNQSNIAILFSNLFSNKSIQEINSKLTKIRQKIQFQPNQVKKQDFQGKRGRGRPKGVRNKPKINNDQSESEQLIASQSMPKRKNNKNMNLLKCCSKCNQRITKRQFIQGKNVPLQDLKNLGINLGIQDTSNIILNVIGQQQLLKQILTRKHVFQNDFIPPWDVNNKLQLASYTVRTKKQYVIKNKRQGMFALLQDSIRFQPSWWKAIGVNRILQNIPNEQSSIQIFKILIQNQPQLQEAIYHNIPTLVRSGNQYLSLYLIQKILNSPSNTTLYGYSKQHLQCLNKTRTDLQFRKSSMLKQNFTQNFCSPIHCAAINSNTQLLGYILKNISDFNVGDSQSRRPIHYAAQVDNVKNLQLLVKYGGDLKDIDKKKMTPLMLAAKSGRFKNIKFILQKIRDPHYINFRGDQGLAAIHYAVIGKHLECLCLFLDDSLVDRLVQTKQGMNILHLAAGTGHKQIVKILLERGIQITPDQFRRTPLMIAIRNNHNDVFFQLFMNSNKYFRRDYSHNTLLHYAAAYGNVEVIKYLLQTNLNLQTPNKKNFYPYQIAVLKGHFQCAKLLQNWNLHYNQHLINRILKNPRGTLQFIKMFQYLLETKKYDVNYQMINSGGYTALHYISCISEEEYYRLRRTQTSHIQEKQYENMQRTLIQLLQKYEADSDLANDRGELPVHLCIQNENLIGIRYLMKEIPFNSSTNQYQTKANNFIYYLTNLACFGKEEARFVFQKLKEVDQKILKEQLKIKKIEWNGFTFLVYLVKRFTQSVLNNFWTLYFKFKKQLKDKKNNEIQLQKQAVLLAFQQYIEHQNTLIKIISLLVQSGADPKAIVIQPKMQKEKLNYRKWGIQHFLMKFPSLKLLKMFMKWIDTNFNMQNSQGKTPLHLFCMWNRQQNLFNPNIHKKLGFIPQQPLPYIDFQQMKQYKGKKCIQYLLQRGLTSNVLDINRSTPLLFSAINGQIFFINILRSYGSSINNVNLKNQIPLIEIIKNKDSFNLNQIQSIMHDDGAKPDFKDLNQRNSLHHLVSNAKNFDTSPELCKKLFQYGVNINSLDKFNRSPIFYCFIKIEEEEVDSHNCLQNDTINDKVQILQTLLNHQSIDLNILDIYNRTPLHYACQKNFFFSILYLLDKNINYDVMDTQGNTPLAICLKHRKLNQAALLIRKGVRYGHVVDQGHKYSYFAYAINKLSVGICFMLIDHGYPLQKALQQAPNQAFKTVLKKRCV